MDLLRNLDKPKRALADVFLSQNDVAPITAMDEFANFMFNMWGAPAGYEAPQRTWMAEAFREYVSVLDRDWPFADILGPIYMALASHKGKQMSGQFFTPAGVSDLLARMTGSPVPTEEAPLRLFEPCVGAGSILLSYLRTMLEDHGATALHHFHVGGVDRDWTCARLCTVQIVAPINIHRFHLGSLTIYQGDALGDPQKWNLLFRATRLVQPGDPAQVATDPSPAPAEEAK